MRVAEKRPGSSWWTVMRGQTSKAHACSIFTSAPHPGMAKSKGWSRTCSAMALARSTRPLRKPTARADSAERRASRRAAREQPEGSEATAETHRVAAQHREREAELGQDLAIELHDTAHFLPDERRVAGEGEDGREETVSSSTTRPSAAGARLPRKVPKRGSTPVRERWVLLPSHTLAWPSRARALFF